MRVFWGEVGGKPGRTLIIKIPYTGYYFCAVTRHDILDPEFLKILYGKRFHSMLNIILTKISVFFILKIFFFLKNTYLGGELIDQED